MMKKKKQKKEKQESPPKNESDDKPVSQSNEGQNLTGAENKGETKAAPPSPAVLPADNSAKKQDTLPDKTPKAEAENANVTPKLDATTVKPEQSTVPQTSESKLLPTVASPEPSKAKDQVAQASEVLADKLNGNQIPETPQTVPENAKKTNESTETAKVSSTIQITELPSSKNEPVQQTPTQQLTTDSKDKVDVSVNNNQGGAIAATLTPAIPDILKIPSSQSTLDVKTDQPSQQPNKIHTITTSELENKKELPLKETKIPETKLADKTIKEQVKGTSNKEVTEIISTGLNEGTLNKTIINQNAKTESPQSNTNAKTESPQSNTNEKPLKEDSVAKNISADKKTGDKNKKPEESKSSEKPSEKPVEKEDKDTKAKAGKNKPAKSKKPNSNSISETPSSDAEIQKPDSLTVTTEAANPGKVLNVEKSSIMTSSTEPKTDTKGVKESAKKTELAVGTQDKKPPEPKTSAVKTEKVNIKEEKLEKESKPSVPEAVISNETPIVDKATKPTSDQKLINENKKPGTPLENQKITPDTTTVTVESEGKEASKPSTGEMQSSSKSKKKKQEKQNSAKTSESDPQSPGEATKAKANPAKSEPPKGTTKTKPVDGNEAAASDKVNTMDKKNEVNPTVTESGEPKSAQNQAKQGKQKGKANDQNKVNTAQKDVSAVDTDVTNKENTSPSNEPVTSETVKGKTGKKKNKKQKADQNSVDKDDKQEIKVTGGDSKQGQEAFKEQNNSASPQKEGSKKSKRKGKGNKTDAAQLENAKDLKQNAEVSNTDVLKDNKANIDSKKAKDPNNTKLNNQNLIISENKQESDKGDLSEITGSQNEPASELASGEAAKKRRRRKRKKQNRGETQDGKSDVQANETKTDTPALKKKAE